MNQKRMLNIIICLVLTVCFVFAINVKAVSPVRCTGGYAGETQSKHSYSLIKSHAVYNYSHTVDRVYSGHIYEEIGHTTDNCGKPTLNYNYSPGCIGTIVGEG